MDYGLAAEDDVRGADYLGASGDFVACVLGRRLAGNGTRGRGEMRETNGFDVFALWRFFRHCALHYKMMSMLIAF